MSRFITRALALLTFVVLGLGFSAEPVKALSARQVNAWSAATVTATSTSASIRTNLGATDPFLPGAYKALAGRAMIQAYFLNNSGTSPTATLTVESSWDNGTTWRALPVCDATGTPSAFFAATTGASSQIRYIPNPVPPMLRLITTLGGTSPNYTLNISVLLAE